MLQLNIEELKQISFSIVQQNIQESPNVVPQQINRRLVDPSDLMIHRPGEGQRAIFDREDIIVNQEELRPFSDHGNIAVNDEESCPTSVNNQVEQHAIVEPSETPKIDCQSSQHSWSYSPPLRPGEYRPPKHRKISDLPVQNKTEATPGSSAINRLSQDNTYRENRPRSRSPSDSRRSRRRSPYRNREYRSRSRSPHRYYRERSYERSHRRYVRSRSRSPYDHKRHRDRSRSPHSSHRERRCSKSPRRYGRSHSPYYDEHRRSQRYSRSPHRDRYGRSRRCTPPPCRHLSSHRERYEPEYKAGGLWIPEAMLASGMFPNCFYPVSRPPFGGPNMQPRPMIPLEVRLPFPAMHRPRPPLVCNQHHRPRILPSATVTSNVAAAPSTSDAASSSVNVTSTSSSHKDLAEKDVNNSTKGEDK